MGQHGRMDYVRIMGRWVRLGIGLFCVGLAAAIALLPAPTAAEEKKRSFRDDCITLSQVRRTKILDDHTILFYMSGKRVKRMTLAFGCPSLTFYESFSYTAYTNRLCARVDSIVSRSGAHCPIADISDDAPPEASENTPDAAKE